MKPAPFAYERVKTLDEALEVLTKFGENARILAGGQSLMATLNMRLSKPDILIDINHIDGLAGIEDTGKNIRVGALTRHVEIETSELITKHVPLISKAVDHIAHPAIRNRGTFGGSIAFADPAAELPACILALDATLELSSKSGVREIKAENFFHGLYETALRPNEILTAVSIPKITPGWKSEFMELSRRQGDYAIIGLATHLKLENGKFGEGRLVFFNAGDRPVSASKTAALIHGQPWSNELGDKLVVSLKEELRPQNDLNADGEMRKYLAGVLTKRTLSTLVGD
ncbi:MAG: xanthine dehydrogenase family protein subunit M [Pseudomonadota bacterium]|nr:xanthine dehydrogenase family protein subunit M [Pseudomonadota bacterium]